MNNQKPNNDLREYRFLRLTILQWMVLLATIGIAATVMMGRIFGG